MDYDMTNPYEIAKYIKEAKKATPVKAYVTGNLEGVSTADVKVFGQGNFWILMGDCVAVQEILESKKDLISDCHLEYDRRNSAVPLLDITGIEARIEPGALIRDRVKIGKNAVVMMGAVINIGLKLPDDIL